MKSSYILYFVVIMYYNLYCTVQVLKIPVFLSLYHPVLVVRDSVEQGRWWWELLEGRGQWPGRPVPSLLCWEGEIQSCPWLCGRGWRWANFDERWGHYQTSYHKWHQSVQRSRSSPYLTRTLKKMAGGRESWMAISEFFLPTMSNILKKRKFYWLFKQFYLKCSFFCSKILFSINFFCLEAQQVTRRKKSAWVFREKRRNY